MSIDLTWTVDPEQPVAAHLNLALAMPENAVMAWLVWAKQPFEKQLWRESFDDNEALVAIPRWIASHIDTIKQMIKGEHTRA